MIRHSVVIVEDEPLARMRLRTLLASEPWLEVSGEAGDGQGGLALIRSTRPAIAFLDIQMPGMDGLRLVESLETPPLIVYTTAHSQHAASAFDVGAIDYLVKPFGRRRLADTFDRLKQALEQSDGKQGLQQLLLRSGQAAIMVRTRDVIRFEGRDDYVAVHANGRRLLSSLRMGELETQLDPRHFIRVHRSHIVNLRAVREVRSDGTGRLVATMHDGSRVRSSRDRAAQLRSLFS